MPSHPEIRDTPPYPYVVVRIMAAVYSRRAVEFVASSEAVLETSSRTIVIQDDEAASTNVVGGAAKQKLIERVLADVKRTGFRMCCVFGPTDCAFCEPDGSEIGRAHV